MYKKKKKPSTVNFLYFLYLQKQKLNYKNQQQLMNITKRWTHQVYYTYCI